MKRRLGDRRGRPRFEIVGELWGTLDTVITMPLVNIGKTGALVRSSIALTPESVHHVSIRCDGLQTPTRVQVRHVRQTQGPDGVESFLIGLEFLSMPSALEAQIAAWLRGPGQTAAETV
jgi:hypothetical protein